MVNFLQFVTGFIITQILLNKVIKPKLHRFGVCNWHYFRNPYVRQCKICGRKQEMFEEARINYFHNIIVVDTWEDV